MDWRSLLRQGFGVAGRGQRSEVSGQRSAIRAERSPYRRISHFGESPRLDAPSRALPIQDFRSTALSAAKSIQCDGEGRRYSTPLN
jgi:hypothetical protein